MERAITRKSEPACPDVSDERAAKAVIPGARLRGLAAPAAMLVLRAAGVGTAVAAGWYAVELSRLLFA